VLHVDDDPGITDIVGTFLERENDRITVESEQSVTDARSHLEDGDVDCIVSDHDMPGENGIEFLEAVRETHPELPFILYTGKGNEAVASDAIAAGVTDYLQKQSGTEQYEILANRIQNAVEQYRASQRAINLTRIRELVTNINQTLVHAESQEEIETQVCEVLANADSYRFAWIGEQDSDTKTVTPRASAGVSEEYLAEVEITTDGTETSHGPTGRALTQRDIVAVQNIEEADSYGPWREHALEYGYRSSAAIPLVHSDTAYGVLNVYSDRPEAFDEEEKPLLVELANDIAHAIHHQRVQRSLRQERDRFQLLVESIERYAIFMLDTDGRVATWNAGARQIKGYEENEILGEHYEEFFAEDDRDTGVPAELLERAQAEGAVEGEGWRVRSDGSRFWADYTLIALYEDSGELRGYAKVTQDLSEQRARKAAIDTQSERLDEFASILSHDLQNPLSVAAGRLEIAEADLDSEHVREAHTAVERAQALTEDVLDLARDDEAGVTLETLNLGDVTRTCWQHVETPTASLVVDTGCVIRADRTRLTQLLENLIRNAVKHSDSDSMTVRVGAFENGFYVEDDGPGIPESEREAVFDAGYSTASESAGLGLDIVQQSARAHGWRVHVTEEATGGARFEFHHADVDVDAEDAPDSCKP
jgi:PAS domain S-box-containing protein